MYKKLESEFLNIEQQETERFFKHLKQDDDDTFHPIVVFLEILNIVRICFDRVDSFQVQGNLFKIII